LKDTLLTGQENNLHNFRTDKDWYIHVVVLYTQTDLRYMLVDEEKRNIHAYQLNVLNFQIPIEIICKYFSLFLSSKYSFRVKGILI
jgi:hypothetical protein